MGSSDALLNWMQTVFHIPDPFDRRYSVTIQRAQWCKTRIGRNVEHLFVPPVVS
jgi:hypothetical protein